MSDPARQFEHWGVVEEWRPVVDFEGLYEVSSSARVRRVGRAARNGIGHGGGARLGRVLRQNPNWGGYQLVQLWKDGLYYNRAVHVLVAVAFLGGRPAGYDVNHRDGDKRNNAPGNLEYLTRSENNLHAYATGLRTVTAA